MVIMAGVMRPSRIEQNVAIERYHFDFFEMCFSMDMIACEIFEIFSSFA